MLKYIVPWDEFVFVIPLDGLLSIYGWRLPFHISDERTSTAPICGLVMGYDTIRDNDDSSPRHESQEGRRQFRPSSYPHRLLSH
ncbi:hypothetical protein V5799_033833 [Amblyomma americanum]|uniref:Uncharacterized protein n=1 Tax=Amblyomma americanum TaxID=6943 RepID=A0AAQ4DM69_AMBAM